MYTGLIIGHLYWITLSCFSYNCNNVAGKSVSKIVLWRHKNNVLSISFLGVFFPSSPLIFLIFMTSHGWFLGHFEKFSTNWQSRSFHINCPNCTYNVQIFIYMHTHSYNSVFMDYFIMVKEQRYKVVTKDNKKQ